MASNNSRKPAARMSAAQGIQELSIHGVHADKAGSGLTAAPFSKQEVVFVPWGETPGGLVPDPEPADESYIDSPRLPASDSYGTAKPNSKPQVMPQPAVPVQILSMVSKHKSPRDLSPIKQHTLRFRSGITNTSKLLAPKYTAASVLEAALDYSTLPPVAPEAALTPDLIADLKARPNSDSLGTAALLGTYSPHASSPRVQATFLGASAKLPFQSASAGILPVPTRTCGSTTSLCNTASTLDGSTKGSMAESLVKLWSKWSQQDVYCFDVPAGVKTGLDAVRLFASSGAKPGLIIFCSINPAAKWYDPYDLLVVDSGTQNKDFFFAISQHGVTLMRDGLAYELVPHQEWIRDAELFAVLKKLSLFGKHDLFHAFRNWRHSVRAARFQRCQKRLERSLLQLCPTYGPPLQAIRQMTLSVTEDTAAGWRKQASAAGSHCSRWVPLKQHSSSYTAKAALDNDDGTSNSQLPFSEGAVPGALQAQPECMSIDSSETVLTTRKSLNQITSLVAPGQQGSTMSVITSQPALPPAAAPADAPPLATRKSTSPSAAAPFTTPGKQQPRGRASKHRSSSTSGATKAPEHRLLQHGEDLPSSGLAAQLGAVAGSTVDTLTLDQFKQQRAQAKAGVQEALAHMFQYVVEQVLVVGQKVSAELHAASATLAPLTRKEAFEKRFHHATGTVQDWDARVLRSLCWLHAGREARQDGSPYFANEALRIKIEHMQAARRTCERLRAFINLADCLILSAVYDLARLSLAITCSQLFAARRQGLFVIKATITPLERVQAAAVLARISASQAIDSEAAEAEELTRSPSPTALSTHVSPVEFQPACDQIVKTVLDVVRDVLAVTAQASLGVTSHLDVRNLVKQVLGNTHGAASTHKDATTAVSARQPAGATEVDSKAEGAQHVQPGTAAGAGGGRVNVVLEQLRNMLQISWLQEQLEDRLATQYQALLKHTSLQPFVGHMAEWALVCAYDATEYNEAKHPPERLDADIHVLRDWMDSLAKCGTMSVFGLMHFDLTSTRSQLLPRIMETYSSMMAGLTHGMMALQKELLARLARYIDRLRNRPSELPDFVAYMELVWPHLDEASFKRQRIHQAQQHLQQLYTTVMAAVPKPDDPEPADEAKVIRPRSAPDGALQLPAITISVRDARPVHLTWRHVQTEIAKYLEEAAAAADFVQHSSSLMSNHLKNSLLQMESDLLSLLGELRLGISTQQQSACTEVLAQLQVLAEQLQVLQAQSAQCNAWAKLLTNTTITQVQSSVERLMEASSLHLSRRTSLWRVIQAWQATLDRVYRQPAEDCVSEELLVPLRSTLQQLDEQVKAITALHVSEGVASINTATPQEAKIAVHYSLVVTAWQSMLAVAEQLSHPSVDARHVNILLSWLHQARARDNGAAHTPGTLDFAERYPVPCALEGSASQGSMPAVPGSPAQCRSPAIQQPAAQPFTLVGITSSGGVIGTTLAQLLSLCSETVEARALTNRAVQLAHEEYCLALRLAEAHNQLSHLQLAFAPQRVVGTFVIINLQECAAELREVQHVLQQTRTSPAWGGIMQEYETLEQLLAYTTAMLQAAASCQSLCFFLSSLTATPEAATAIPEAAAALQPLLGVWRKYALSAQEVPNVVDLPHTMPEVQVLLEALNKVQDMAQAPMLHAVRDAYPRTFLVPDNVLLEAVASAQAPESLPKQCLSICFSGLTKLQAQDAAATTTPASNPSHMPTPSTVSMTGLLQTAVPTVVIGVTGEHGETMQLEQSIQTAINNQPHPLAHVLHGLEDSLRQSLKVNFLRCMQCCGHMQADQWVASFPAQCILLVDAVAWTQTVTTTLARVAEGEHMALRNLLDQSVLRLEGLAKQLRSAAAAAAASDMGLPHADSFETCVSGDMHAVGGTSSTRVVSSGVPALKALISAGVAHRQVVESLVAYDVAVNPDSWEWLQHVRHYWDSEFNMLHVAFAQSRLPYGWEYEGRAVEPSSLLLPVSQCSLLAAVNALQTSPCVAMPLAASQGDGQACITALCHLMGKFCVRACLGPDDTASSCSRLLQGALASDCWLALHGTELLDLRVLSLLGQQLHAIWSAYFHGGATITLARDDHGAEVEVMSPWARVAAVDAPMPFALFLPMPATVFGSSEHWQGEACAAGACQLSDTLRRICRTIQLSAPDACLMLETALRCQGLRDAAEAARAVECFFNMLAMQLPYRPQYIFNLTRVKAVLAAVQHVRQAAAQLLPDSNPPCSFGSFHTGRAAEAASDVQDSFTPAVATPMTAQSNMSRSSYLPWCTRPDPAACASGTGLSRHGLGSNTGSTLDVLKQALWVVVLSAAQPDETQLVSELIDEALTTRTRSPSHTQAVHGTMGEPHDLHPGMCFGLPVVSEVCALVQKMLLPGPAMPASTSSTLVANAPFLTSLAYESEPRMDGMEVGILPAVVCSGAAAVQTNRFTSMVGRLAAALSAHGACMLVGPPGVGKSILWKSLVVAVSGEQALQGTFRLNNGCQVLRVYPSTQNVSIRKNPYKAMAPAHSGSNDDSSVAAQGWQRQLLDAASYIPRTKALAGKNSQLLLSMYAEDGDDEDGCGPGWVVIDGPIGTSSSDTLSSILTRCSKQSSESKHQVLGLAYDSKVVWECSSLQGASPALLSSAPIVHVSSPVVDTDQSVLACLQQVAALHTAGAASGCDASAMSDVVQQLWHLVCSAIQQFKTLLCGSPASAQEASASPASPHSHEASSRQASSPCSVNVDQPATARQGLTLHHDSSMPLELLLGFEHGDVFLATSLRTFLGLLRTVAEGLDQQTSPELALSSLGRACLFCLYWSFAAVPLPTAHRAIVDDVLKQAATACSLQALLPQGDGSVAAHLLHPALGTWCSWQQAVEPMMRVRHGVQAPAYSRWSSVPGGAGLTPWHMYQDPLTGAACMHMPTAATVALQHVCMLSMRAGLHPLLVGSTGSGRGALLRHLAATARVLKHTRCEVLGLCMGPSSSPQHLSQLLHWHLTPGMPHQLRAPLGTHLLLLVEDISAVAASSAAAEGLTAPKDVFPASLEWLRGMLDAERIHDGNSLQLADNSLLMSGVSVCATSAPDYLIQGPHQLSARMWRHLHPLHTHAALPGSPAADHVLYSSSPAGHNVLTLFSSSQLLSCLSHRCLLDLAVGPAGVPQLATLGPAGVQLAGQVLGAALLKLLQCVAGLQRLQLLGSQVQFSMARMAGVLDRVQGAAAQSSGGCWALSDVVHRLLFEVNQELSSCLLSVNEQDVLARVTLQAMGKELGMLLKGKLQPESPLTDAWAVAAVPMPPLGTGITGQGLVSATEGMQHAGQEKEDVALAALWEEYATSAEGPSMTALRVSLVGKILPSDIDQLVSAARADALRQAGYMAVQHAVEAVYCYAAGAAVLGGGPVAFVPPNSRSRPTTAGAALTQQHSTGSSIACSQQAAEASSTSQSGGGALVLTSSWPVWLPAPAVPVLELLDTLQQVSATAAEQGKRHYKPLGFALHNLPATQARVSIDGSNTPRGKVQPVVSPRSQISPRPREAAKARPIVVPILQLQLLQRTSDTSDIPSPIEARETLDSAALTGIHAQLGLDVLVDWEYGATLATCACMLSEQHTCGQHVMLCGTDTEALLHMAHMAVVHAGGRLLTLEACGNQAFLQQGHAHNKHGSGHQQGPQTGSPTCTYHRLWQLLCSLLLDDASAARTDQASPRAPTSTAATPLDTASQAPLQASSPAPTEQDATTERRLPQHTTIVLDDAVVNGEGVMELLQLLLLSPSLAAHLLVQSASAAAQQRYDQQLHQLLHAHASHVTAASTPSAKRATGWGLVQQATTGVSPRMVAVTVEELRRLMDSKGSSLGVFDGALSNRLPSTHRSHASAMEPPTPSMLPRTTKSSLMTRRNQGVRGAAQPSEVAAAHSLSMGRQLLERLRQDDQAASLVQQKRDQEAGRLKLAQQATLHVQDRLRVVMAISATTAAQLRARYPRLARVLLQLSVHSPSPASQEQAATQHILAAAHKQQENGLLQCTPPALPQHKLAAAINQPTSRQMSEFAAQCVAAGVKCRADENTEVAEAAAAAAGASAEAAGSVPVAASSSLQHNAAASNGEAPQVPASAEAVTAAVVQSEQPVGILSSGGTAAEAGQRGIGDTPGSALHSAGTDAGDASPGASLTSGMHIPIVHWGADQTLPSDLPLDELRHALEDAGQLATGDDVYANSEYQATLQAQRAARLAGVLLEAHQQAQQLLIQQGMLAVDSQLPHTMVADTVDVLARVHGAQCKTLRSKQASLWMALHKLGHEASHMVVDLEGSTAIQAALNQRSEQQAEAARKLQVLNCYEARLVSELAEQEGLVAEQAAVVYAVAAEIDAAMEAAMKRYRQALQEVGGLTEQDLAELRSYAAPPERVRLVMMAVTALFDAPPDWRSAQKLLGEQNPKLLERLVNYDIHNISMLALAKLQRIVSEPEFNIVQVAQVSQAAKPLCWWALSLHELLRVGREADLKRLKIAEAEARLEEARKYVRRLKGELSAAQNEKARRQAAYDAACADIAEMQAILTSDEVSPSIYKEVLHMMQYVKLMVHCCHAVLDHRDMDQASSNAQQLGAATAVMRQGWEEQLKVVEAQLQPLLGDATLTALAVVYLGPCLPQQQAAALSCWAQLLDAANIPVSGCSNGGTPFDLHTFLNVRAHQLLAEMTAATTATTHAAWLDALMLSELSWHVPLFLDPGEQLVPLLKAKHKAEAKDAKEPGVRCWSLLTKDLPAKVSGAVQQGSVVCIDLVMGTAAELHTLLNTLVAYRSALLLRYPSHVCPPRHLYLRLKQPQAALNGGWYRWVSPARLGWDQPQLRAALHDMLVALVDGQAAVVLRDMKTRLMEMKQECDGLSETVAYCVSHTHGSVYADQVLVDTTIARTQHAAATKEQLDELAAQMQGLECQVLPPYMVSLLDASLLVYNSMAHLAAAMQPQCIAAAAPHVYLNIFKVAAREALLRHDMLSYDGQYTPHDPELHAGLDAHGGAANHGSSSSSSISCKQDACAALDSDGTLPQPQAPLGQLKPQASAGDAAGNGELGEDAGRCKKIPLLGRTMLRCLSQLIGAYLSPPQACVLNLMLSLDVLHTEGSISAAELHFSRVLLRDGPPAVPGSSSATGLLGSLAPAAASSRASKAGVRGTTSMAGTTRITGNGVRATATTSLAAAALGSGDDSDQVESNSVVNCDLATRLKNPAVAAVLHWLEGSYPNPVFQGIQAAINAAPEAWRAVLWSDDLAVPQVLARQLPPLQYSAVSQQPTLATATEMASLASLAAALAAKTHSSAVHKHQLNASPDGDSTAQTPSVGTGGMGYDGRGAQQGQSQMSSLVKQATTLQLVAKAPDLPRPVGSLPEHWAQARLRSPLHWLLLVAVVAPQQRLAVAAEWLSCTILGDGVRSRDPTPGEQVLMAALTVPASRPTVLACSSDEGTVAALEQAAALLGSHADGMWRPPAGALPGEQQLTVLHWGQLVWPQLRETLQHAIQKEQWLCLLNMHTATEHELATLLNWLAQHEYLLRGDEVVFRLLLAMPESEIANLPYYILQQALIVSLHPPASLVAAARSIATQLAHSSATYIGFYKSCDPELHHITLGTAVAVAALGRVFRAAAGQDGSCCGFGWWDVMHALHLAKLFITQARSSDPSLDIHSLDINRLLELLLTDVFQPMCPSPLLRQQVQTVISSFIAPALLNAAHPLHRLAEDRDPDATDAVPTCAWPFNTRSLPEVLAALDMFLDTRHTSLAALDPQAAAMSLHVNSSGSGPSNDQGGHVRASNTQHVSPSPSPQTVPGSNSSRARRSIRHCETASHKFMDVHKIAQSLACNGPWPLRLLLQYTSSAAAQYAAWESRACCLLLSQLQQHPAPPAAESSMMHASGRTAHRTLGSSKSVLRLRGPKLSVCTGPSQARSTSMEGAASAAAAEDPCSPAARSSVSRLGTKRAPSLGGNASIAAKNIVASRKGRHGQLQHLEDSHSKAAKAVQEVGWADSLALRTDATSHRRSMQVIQAAVQPMLRQVSMWLAQHCGIARELLEQLHAHDLSEYSSRAQLLGSFLERMLLGGFQREAKALLVELICASKAAAGLMSMLNDPGFASTTSWPATAALQLGAGLLPDAWQLSSKSNFDRQTLDSWMSSIKGREAFIQAIGRALGSCGNTGQGTPLPTFDMRALQHPLLPMAISMRAHAKGHSMQLANVACRAVPKPCSGEKDSSLALSATTSSVSTPGARLTLTIEGLSLQDAYLTSSSQHGSAQPAALVTPSDVFLIHDLPVGSTRASCGVLQLLPCVVERRTRSTHASRSPEPRVSAVAGTAAGSSQGLMLTQRATVGDSRRAIASPLRTSRSSQDTRQAYGIPVPLPVLINSRDTAAAHLPHLPAMYLHLMCRQLPAGPAAWKPCGGAQLLGSTPSSTPVQLRALCGVLAASDEDSTAVGLSRAQLSMSVQQPWLM